MDKENIENFQTDKVIVINSGIPYKRYITFSIAYDIGALLFDFSEDKDASYSFVFREKHQKGFLFEKSSDKWIFFIFFFNNSFFNHSILSLSGSKKSFLSRLGSASLPSFWSFF